MSTQMACIGSTSQLLIGGKTIDEWDKEWDPIEGGYAIPHPELRHLVGLHRALLGGKVMFIGRATETPGGFAKRLADYRRKSSSARKYGSAALMFDNCAKLKLEIILVGYDQGSKVVTKKLLGPMIKKHSPEWNHSKARFIKVVKSGLVVYDIP